MIDIIPAIDLIGGNCVRLTKGDFNSRSVYSNDPLDMAYHFEGLGARSLHIVDLDAASGNLNAHRGVISEIATKTSLMVQVGGGIREKSQVDYLLGTGVTKVIIGSKAQTDKDELKEWIADYGSGSIIIGADVIDGNITTHGWKRRSEEKLEDFINDYLEMGAREFLCTDVARDGMLEGPAVELYSELVGKFEYATFIASGGVSSDTDVQKLVDIGMQRIIVGKAFYEGRIDLQKLFKKFRVC